jgi:hypothetical protein
LSIGAGSQLAEECVVADALGHCSVGRSSAQLSSGVEDVTELLKEMVRILTQQYRYAGWRHDIRGTNKMAAEHPSAAILGPVNGFLENLIENTKASVGLRCSSFHSD